MRSAGQPSGASGSQWSFRALSKQRVSQQPDPEEVTEGCLRDADHQTLHWEAAGICHALPALLQTNADVRSPLQRGNLVGIASFCCLEARWEKMGERTEPCSEMFFSSLLFSLPCWDGKPGEYWLVFGEFSSLCENGRPGDGCWKAFRRCWAHETAPAYS